MPPALARLDHRPWPIPERAWTWRQSWLDLLFAHWPVSAATLRPLVPAELEIDEHDGTSWVGVVPFRMADVARRPLPPLPGISAFPELNLRLYVRHQGKAGVWFLSLDAANWLVVRAARQLFHVPYVWAGIAFGPEGETGFRLASSRLDAPRALGFEAAYRPCSEPFEATPGSLDHWLTERYCLYARSAGGELFRVDVHHGPWPLHRAEAEIRRNELGRPHGLDLESAPPAQLHFSRGVEVVAWGAERLR